MMKYLQIAIKIVNFDPTNIRNDCTNCKAKNFIINEPDGTRLHVLDSGNCQSMTICSEYCYSENQGK